MERLVIIFDRYHVKVNISHKSTLQANAFIIYCTYFTMFHRSMIFYIYIQCSKSGAERFFRNKVYLLIYIYMFVICSPQITKKERWHLVFNYSLFVFVCLCIIVIIRAVSQTAGWACRPTTSRPWSASNRWQADLWASWLLRTYTAPHNTPAHCPNHSGRGCKIPAWKPPLSAGM